MARTKLPNSEHHYDAFFKGKAFVKFLDLHTEYRDASFYQGQRKAESFGTYGGGQWIDPKLHYGTFINGVKRAGKRGASDQRSINRWRRGGAVTLDAADKLLLRYNLTLTEFEDWAEETEQNYLINREDTRNG